MPGIAASMSICAFGNINAALRNEFQGQRLEDAERAMDLLGKAHVWEDALLEEQRSWLRVMFWILACVSTCLILFKDPVSAKILIGPALLILLMAERWLRRRRINQSRRELETLVASNPEYWNAMITRVKEIIIENGKTDCFGFEKQVTRLINR
jgi:hypothetical protein